MGQYCISLKSERPIGLAFCLFVPKKWKGIHENERDFGPQFLANVQIYAYMSTEWLDSWFIILFNIFLNQFRLNRSYMFLIKWFNSCTWYLVYMTSIMYLVQKYQSYINMGLSPSSFMSSMCINRSAILIYFPLNGDKMSGYNLTFNFISQTHNNKSLSVLCN